MIISEIPYYNLMKLTLNLVRFCVNRIKVDTVEHDQLIFLINHTNDAYIVNERQLTKNVNIFPDFHIENSTSSMFVEFKNTTNEIEIAKEVDLITYHLNQNTFTDKFIYFLPEHIDMNKIKEHLTRKVNVLIEFIIEDTDELLRSINKTLN